MEYCKQLISEYYQATAFRTHFEGISFSVEYFTMMLMSPSKQADYGKFIVLKCKSQITSNKSHSGNRHQVIYCTDPELGTHRLCLTIMHSQFF